MADECLQSGNPAAFAGLVALEVDPVEPVVVELVLVPVLLVLGFCAAAGAGARGFESGRSPIVGRKKRRRPKAPHVVA